MTKNQTIKVKSWMIQHAAEYDSATELAEGAAAAIPAIAYELDDETSDVWNLAFEIFTE